jgi:hypothetical protein
MQTSLPELRFTNYGKVELLPYHSSRKPTPRAYPRTDLQTLTPWTSFPNDIHQAIQSATTRANLPPTPFDISNYPRTTFVDSEASIHTHADVALHDAVGAVMKMLGVNGRFAHSGCGSIALLGAPDFSWVVGSAVQPHPKVVVSAPVITRVLDATVCLCRLSTNLGG